MKNLYKIKDELYIISDKEKSSYCIKECPMAGLTIDRCDCSIQGGCSNKVGTVILTTNDLLIKDGVQDIPDDFLEWFVKNPSCEEVEVEIETTSIQLPQQQLSENSYDLAFRWINKKVYKIIIPKEKPKQDKIMERFIANAKQETLEENCTCTDECLGYLTKTCKGIEETALRLYPNRESFLDRFQDIEREAFIKGYKLAKERSYSEEEVLEILKDFRDNIPNDVYVVDWFEQFKKK